MGKIKKCDECSRYTLQDTCPECDGDTSSPEPPKFSHPDRYGEQRREAKRRARDEEDTDGNTDS